MPGERWMEAALQDIRNREQWRSLDARVIQGRQGRTVEVNGRTLLCFASNDYLGLASSDAVVDAAKASLDECGHGAGASRHVTGSMEPHGDLEGALSSWMRAEQCVLFGSGTLANLGIISTLVGPGDAVFSDELNHASLIDGCRLSRAQVHVYRHGDVDHLRELLMRNPAPRRLVVTDSVFSMDGDVAPLPELVALARAHDVMVMVDEAHALGVLGGGRGACVEAGVDSDVTVRMGTMGKALGGYGAFAVGRRAVVDLLVNQARSLVFSTALPPHVCAGALAALQEVADGKRTRRLQELQRVMMHQLRRHQLQDMLPPSLRGADSLPTPIVPLLVGDNAACLDLAAGLQEAGFLVVGIRPPTVAPGTARLRVTLSALHLDEDVAALCGQLATLRAPSRLAVAS